jgi:hypothetical protein
MKKILLTLLAIAILLGSNSCKKFVSGYEVSPNSASEANPALLLSASELAVFATYGGSISRNASMWTQQSAGCQFQSQAIDEYALDEGDVQNEWQVVYQGMKNARVLKEKAGTDNPNYQGISNVITALLLGVTTDIWGDVPYRDAFKGQELQYTAEYDNQQQVIGDIQTLLSDAVTLLSNNSNLLSPGSDDFIYGGDVQKWKGLAYALKARYAARLSKRNASWYIDALKFSDSAIANGFKSGAADANCVFGNKSNEYNQWYAFVKVERTGYIYTDSGFVHMMVANNDPRVPFYFSQNDSGKYAGSALGSYNTDNVSEIGSYFASQSSPTPIATYTELLFIRAEAYLAAGNKPDAAKTYNSAVLAHVQQVTGAAAPGAFVASTASESAGSISQTKIMTQKYIAGYTMTEVFSDWRRTDIPKLSKNPNATLSGIPRRYPCSLEERLYNSKAAGHLFGINDLATARVWWDN